MAPPGTLQDSRSGDDDLDAYLLDMRAQATHWLTIAERTSRTRNTMDMTRPVLLITSCGVRLDGKYGTSNEHRGAHSRGTRLPTRRVTCLNAVSGGKILQTQRNHSGEHQLMMCRVVIDVQIGRWMPVIATLCEQSLLNSLCGSCSMPINQWPVG